MTNKALYIEHIRKIQENSGSSLEIVRDMDIAERFEKETGKSIGVIDNQPYYNINLDLYREKDSGRLFRYCNVEYNRNGAGMLIVFKSDDEKSQNLYLFEKHFRQFTNSYHYEIPRGFADAGDLTSKVTAVREIAEETGLVIEVSELLSLGTVFPDTGLTNSEVHLFAAELKADNAVLSSLKRNNTSENIHDFILISHNELLRMISENQLSDAFSLTALLKYWNLLTSDKTYNMI